MFSVGSWAIFAPLLPNIGSTRWRSWLRHHATSRKVAGSIPNSVTGICHWHNPYSHTMALSTRNISGAWGWQPYQILEPSGLLISLCRHCLTFILAIVHRLVFFKYNLKRSNCRDCSFVQITKTKNVQVCIYVWRNVRGDVMRI
jgi:hypothetical protein